MLGHLVVLLLRRVGVEVVVRTTIVIVGVHWNRDDDAMKEQRRAKGQLEGSHVDCLEKVQKKGR